MLDNSMRIGLTTFSILFSVLDRCFVLVCCPLRHLSSFSLHGHAALCPARLKGKVVLSSLLCHQMTFVVFDMVDFSSSTSDVPNIDFPLALQIHVSWHGDRILCILCILYILCHMSRDKTICRKIVNAPHENGLKDEVTVSILIKNIDGIDTTWQLLQLLNKGC